MKIHLHLSTNTPTCSPNWKTAHGFTRRRQKRALPRRRTDPNTCFLVESRHISLPSNCPPHALMHVRQTSAAFHRRAQLPDMPGRKACSYSNFMIFLFHSCTAWTVLRNFKLPFPGGPQGQRRAHKGPINADQRVMSKTHSHISAGRGDKCFSFTY